MSNRQIVDRMITALGESLGQPDLALNQDGALTLNPSPYWFAFNWDKEQETLHIRVHAGDISGAENQAELLEDALMANRYFEGVAGGALGLYGQDLVLSYRLDFPLVAPSIDEEVKSQFAEEDLNQEITPEAEEAFLIEFLPRLAGAASVFLSGCGVKVP
ncbi:MAG: type III secretion system chaperone [Deltaproteobacteria bacterium]|jgi:hypothetical protein|nr:type III secretion system chaperone [Deltaproteobacteria bacterium]